MVDFRAMIIAAGAGLLLGIVLHVFYSPASMDADRLHFTLAGVAIGAALIGSIGRHSEHLLMAAMFIMSASLGFLAYVVLVGG